MPKKDKDRHNLPLVVIVGPTASGKTRLAISLAEKLGGEIVNADSRSIYRGLPILTAAPTKAERQAVPHHLFETQPLTRVMTLLQYQTAAHKLIKEIINRGHIPFLVGGSALYINSVVYNYNIPTVKPNLKLRKQLEKLNLEQLVKKLQRLSPIAIRQIDTRNKRRVVRAIEVVQSLGELPSNKLAYNLSPQTVIIGLQKNSKVLKKNIESRIDEMFRRGVLAEVHRNEKTLKSNLPIATSCGAGPILELIEGHVSTATSKEQFVKNDLRLVKKQMTWFKRDPNIHWVKSEKAAAALIRSAIR